MPTKEQRIVAARDLGIPDREIAKVEYVGVDEIKAMESSGKLEHARNDFMMQNPKQFRSYYDRDRLITMWEKRIELAGEAMDKLGDLLHSEDEKVQLAAAKELAKPILNAPQEQKAEHLVLDKETERELIELSQKLVVIRQKYREED